MADRQQLIVPTVHLNGTSKNALLEQRQKAWDAINKAFWALNEGCPNARDFYVQDDGAFTRAANRHRARLDQLKAISDELLEEYEAIDEQ